MKGLKITVRMNAERSDVVVVDRGETSTFDRSAMAPWQRNKLRRMLVEAWRQNQ